MCFVAKSENQWIHPSERENAGRGVQENRFGATGKSPSLYSLYSFSC